MKLSGFLQQYGWNTAASVTALVWRSGDGLTIEIEAYPFWLPPNERQGQREIKLRLDGIRESNIDLNWDPVELNGVEAVRADPLLWHHQRFVSIYCNAPLMDPDEFLRSYLSLCASLDLGRDPLQYLNASPNIDGWAAIVSEQSYNLLSAPAPIGEGVAELLKVRQIPFSIVTNPNQSDVGGLVAVWIGSSWVVCEEATIEV